jgi:phenylacetate-CoA ligase
MQDALLARYVREELYPFSAHYRRAFDRAGVGPRTIRGVDDLRRLPFTTKKDLLDAQGDPESRQDFVLVPSPGRIRAHWPFARKLALVLGGARARELVRRSYTPNFLTFTTGRSSDPIAFAYTPHDLELLGQVGARTVEVLGVTDPMARILNLFPFAPHLAFWSVTLGGFHSGQMVLSTGGGKLAGSAGNRRMMARFQPTVLVGTPGFVYHMLREARDHDVRLADVELVVLGAEKVTPGLKHKMAEYLEACGARDVTISGTYGFTEARMAFGECPAGQDESTGYHLYPDLGVFEVIDPGTHEPLGEGQTGELVYTTISGHGTVVCRYRTGDLCVGGITWEPCPWCGRTLPRASSELRRVSDQHALNLTKIKGTLVDLSQMGTVLAGLEGLEEWRVVISKKDDDPHEIDQLVVRAALKNGTDAEDLQRRLREELKAATEVAPNRVEILPLAELLEELGMETEMKEKRFLDRRPK